jgi:hypothetical protein
MPDIGSQRMEALSRLWTLLYQAVIGYVLGIVVGLIALVWTPIDLIWQALSNRDDLSADSLPARWSRRILGWNVDQTSYGLFGGGSGEFYWTPKAKFAI